MRFFLITTFCVSCALALGGSEDRSKRDILPGDPRYGYHYPAPQQQLHYDSGVEIVKSDGGYVGSYSVPDNTGSYQAPQLTYGPPNHQPGKPLDHYIPQFPQIVEIGKKENQLSSINYQNNDQASEQVAVSNNVGVKSAFNTPVTSYGTPVTHAETAVHTETETHEDDLAASVGSKNLISTPAVSEQPPLFSDAKVNEESVHSEDVQTSTQSSASVVEVKHDASAFAAPVTSYGTPVIEANSQSLSAPVTSYGTPVSQVSVEANSFPSTSTVNKFAEHEQATISHSPSSVKLEQYALKAAHNSHNQDYHSNTFGNSFGSTFQNFGSVGSFSGFDAPSAGPGGPSQGPYYPYPVNYNRQSIYSVNQPSTSFQNVQHYPVQYTSLQASGPQFHAGSQVLVQKTYSPSIVQHQVSTSSFNNHQNTYTSVGAFNSHRISSDFGPFGHSASDSSVTPKNYFIQPVDKNGGYLYR